MLPSAGKFGCCGPANGEHEFGNLWRFWNGGVQGFLKCLRLSIGDTQFFLLTSRTLNMRNNQCDLLKFTSNGKIDKVSHVFVLMYCAPIPCTKPLRHHLLKTSYLFARENLLGNVFSENAFTTRTCSIIPTQATSSCYLWLPKKLQVSLTGRAVPGFWTTWVFSQPLRKYSLSYWTEKKGT